MSVLILKPSRTELFEQAHARIHTLTVSCLATTEPLFGISYPRIYFFPEITELQPVNCLIAGPSGRSPAEIVGSNPAEGMNVCLL